MADIFFEMNNNEYHARPELNNSALKLLDRSPLHYWNAYINPDREPRTETPAMMLGTATHTAFLEPGEFDARYLVVPDGVDKRSNAGKQFFADIKATGKVALKPDDFKRIKNMAAAMRSNPIVQIIFEKCNPIFEASIFFERRGIGCRIRPDLYVEPCDIFPTGLIADLKTTSDARPEEFARTAWNLDYHIQNEFYSFGFMKAFNQAEPPKFLFLTVESDAPHANAVYTMDDELIAYSRRKVHRLLDLFSTCSASGVWPGYDTKAVQLIMPAWSQKSINEGV